MEQFKLWNNPISSFCQEIKSFTNEAESLNKESKIKFSEVFSDVLDRCNKMKTIFELKENVQPVFKKKRNVFFASLKQINDELNRFEKMGVLSKVDNSNWASPMVYIKKTSEDIRLCVDFSTDLNHVLKCYHYPLPGPEEVFAQLSGVGGVGYFRKST